MKYRELSGSYWLKSQCAKSFGEGLNVTDIYLYVKDRQSSFNSYCLKTTRSRLCCVLATVVVVLWIRSCDNIVCFFGVGLPDWFSRGLEQPLLYDFLGTWQREWLVAFEVSHTPRTFQLAWPSYLLLTNHCSPPLVLVSSALNFCNDTCAFLKALAGVKAWGEDDEILLSSLSDNTSLFLLRFLSNADITALLEP